jgi:hypothetical protein
MLRKGRNVAMVVLCGGMLLQGGCAGALLPLLFQIGGTLVFRTVVDAILGPAM